MAEYHVLIPGSIILSFVILLALGGGINNIYQDAADLLLGVFGGEAAEAAEATEEPEDICVPSDEILNQDGGSYCEHSDNCDHVEPQGHQDFNIGMYVAGEPVDVFVIKAGRTYHILTPENPNNGCMSAVFYGNAVSWEKADVHGRNCQDVSHVQAWESPLCP